MTRRVTKTTSYCHILLIRYQHSPDSKLTAVSEIQAKATTWLTALSFPRHGADSPLPLPLSGNIHRVPLEPGRAYPREST
jgi:hypothetical protein